MGYRPKFSTGVLMSCTNLGSTQAQPTLGQVQTFDFNIQAMLELKIYACLIFKSHLN